MEPNEVPELPETPVSGGIVSAKGDLGNAGANVESVRAELADSAAEAVSQAGQNVASVVSELSGAASLAANNATMSVAKYVDSVKGTAAKQLDNAITGLFEIRASPLVTSAQQQADVQRGDIYQSVYEQVLAPMVNAGELPPVVPHVNGSCPPGYVFNGRISSCELVGTPDVGPEPAIPGPIIQQPPSPPIFEPLPPTGGTCPPPQVIVVPVQPCAAPPEPKPPEKPPEKPPAECDPEDPESPGYPCEPEEAPPPKPVPEGEPAPEPGPMPPEVEPDKKPYGPTVQPMKVLPGIAGENWSDPQYCALIGGFGIAPPAKVPDLSDTTIGLNAVTGALDSVLGAIYTPLFKGVGVDISTVFSPFTALRQWAEAQVESISGPILGVTAAKAGEAIAAIATAEWVERVTGAPARYLTQGYVYDLQHARPQFLPSQSEVNAMYLANVIGSDLWTCLTRANGNHEWAQRLVVDASRTRPNIGELIRLYRRGLMPLESLRSAAQGQGVILDADLQQLIASTDYIPGPSEIVRFMVRDTEDPAVFIPNQYDSGFLDKYNGQLEEWGRANGIDPSVMLRIWRAHWELPSPTQLYQMLHRLRPGRVAPGREVTPERVETTLKANDMAPGFIGALMDVSYNVITRTDLLAWYTNGAIDRGELIERLMDTGYNRPDATRIVEAWDFEVSNRKANRSRVWTRPAIVKAYIDGSINRQTATDLLLRTIPSRAEVDITLDDADVKRLSEKTAACLKAVRKRRIMGEIDSLESIREIVGLGVDHETAVTIADKWECETVSLAREPRVAMVQQWFLAGVLDVNQFFTRLRNLRYTPDDANRIVATTVLNENQKRAKQQAADAERLARKQAAAARQAAAAARKIAKANQPPAGGK